MSVSAYVPKELGRRGMVFAILLALSCWYPFAVLAEGERQTLNFSWTDPLLADPPVLEAGAAILPGDAQAKPCEPPPSMDGELTLLEAVDLVLCHDTKASAAWADIKIQAASLGEARSAYLPVVNGSLSRLHDRTSYPGSPFSSSDIWSTTKNLGLSWRLFDFGARGANQRAAQAMIDAAVASYDAALQKALGNAIGSYFDTRRTFFSWQLFGQSEASALQTVQAAQRREASGYGARSETLQAKAALAKVRLSKIRAEGEFKKNLASLLHQTGLPPDTRLKFAAEQPVGEASLQADLDQWLVQVQNWHPAIRAARAQLSAAQERESAARLDGNPTIDLSANFYQNGRPGQGVTSTSTREVLLGMTLNIPIFDGFSRAYKARGALAQVELKRQEMEETSRQVVSDLLKAHAQASASLANLEVSLQLLTASQEALASVQRKFEYGAADIVEVLTSQTVLIDAQQEQLRCTSEWLSARLQLFSVAGQLGRSRLQGEH